MDTNLLAGAVTAWAEAGARAGRYLGACRAAIDVGDDGAALAALDGYRRAVYDVHDAMGSVAITLDDAIHGTDPGPLA